MAKFRVMYKSTDYVSDLLDGRLTGVVAIKIAEQYNKPCILLKKHFDKKTKTTVFGGSARNIDNSPIDSFKDIVNSTGFVNGKGHANAFGIVNLPIDDKEKAINMMNSILRNTEYDSTYRVDFILDINHVTIPLIIKLSQFEDIICQGIDEPMLAIENISLTIDCFKVFGKNEDTISFMVNDIKYIQFKCKEGNQLYDFLQNAWDDNDSITFNIVGKPSINEYNGIRTPQIKTNGVFQVESAGMKDLLIRLKPKLEQLDFEVISVILALYRPDSMGALDEYVEMATGGSRPPSIHPDMDEILKDTNYCMIYQEQLLDIVKKFGGRTYGGADLFRKAIGKKIVELVQKESEILRGEIVANGYSKEIADKIANELSQKGGYLFNKSHSYSYAVLCFETAWFKAHYPTYFFKALFNQNKDKAGAINKYILDARYFNVDIMPPNINHSGMNFTVDKDKVLFGLSAIGGIGESLSKQIIEERENNGIYKSFDDLIQRLSLGKASVIALIKSGAIPCKNKREKLISYLKSEYQPLKFSEVQSLPTYKKLESDWNINLKKYVISSSGKRIVYDKEALLTEYNKLKKIQFEENQKVRFQKYIDDNKKYLEDEQFWEFQTLQVFINDNPFDAAYTFLTPFEDVPDGEKCTLVGIIAKVQKKKDKNGKQFAYINIYSSFGLVEGIVWHCMYSPQERAAYKERFPNCECVKIKKYSDGSQGSSCPYGAFGDKDGNIGLNIAEECYMCTHYKPRQGDIKVIDEVAEYYQNEKDRLIHMIQYAGSRLGELEKDVKEYIDKHK